jgi:hypothetical protein
METTGEEFFIEEKKATRQQKAEKKEWERRKGEDCPSLAPTPKPVT